MADDPSSSTTTTTTATTAEPDSQANVNDNGPVDTDTTSPSKTGANGTATDVLSPPLDIKSPPLPSSSTLPPAPAPASPRSSLDDAGRIAQLEHELATTRGEKDTLGNQYRSLLGKLTAMRQSLGDKLREDAEELDRRETQINQLTNDNSALQNTISTLQSELLSQSNESSSLQAQLTQLRSQSDSSSSDVLSLTREMRELRGEMERLRVEREEWEIEAGRERERREEMEEELRAVERRERESKKEWERGREELYSERERARNLQEVLSEFQTAKDSELRQATEELETQLRLAATSLSEFKLRAANAETRLGELSKDTNKLAGLEKEIREKNQLIAKLRHDAVVTNEHLTEALRRLRKNSSDTNVDRRLVNNILLSFIATPRADSKRFEMLSLLATILSWTDAEREKAGLQRIGGGKPVPPGKMVRKGTAKGKDGEERSAEEEAAMNESFSNLFVEFLLKESSHGQTVKSSTRNAANTTTSTSSPSSTASPGGSSTVPLPPLRSPNYYANSNFSPTESGATTPFSTFGRSRVYSSGSVSSALTATTSTATPDGLGVVGGAGTLPASGRKGSQNLQDALGGKG